jgi:hypothetical protein
MFNECLSRQSGLVINIVGTDDISLLPRLVTGLTEVGQGGGGRSANPPPPCCPVYTPQSVVSRFPPTHPGIRAASGRQRTGGVDTIHSSFAAASRLPPFPLCCQPCI